MLLRNITSTFQLNNFYVTHCRRAVFPTLATFRFIISNLEGKKIGKLSINPSAELFLNVCCTLSQTCLHFSTFWEGRQIQFMCRVQQNLKRSDSGHISKLLKQIQVSIINNPRSLNPFNIRNATERINCRGKTY